MNRFPSLRPAHAGAITSRLRSWIGVSSGKAAHPIIGSMVALGIGFGALVFAPAISGYLSSQGEVLGSLDDRHAQVLLLVVAPVLWAGYLWQPSAISRVWATLAPLESGPPQRESVGTTHPRLPIFAGASAALAIIFDLSQVLPNSGSWWGTGSALTVALREALLGVSVFVMVRLLVRHVRAISSWSSFARGDRPPEPGLATAALTEYGLGSAALLAVVGIRLVIEAIELPGREGRITPDFYLKAAMFLLAAVALIVLPWARLLGGVLPELGSRSSRMLAISTVALAPFAAAVLIGLTGS